MSLSRGMPLFISCKSVVQFVHVTKSYILGRKIWKPIQSNFLVLQIMIKN